MNEKGFIKNIVVIIILLTVVFLSQQSYFREYGKNLYSQIKPQTEAYWSKTAYWFKTNIYPRVSGEVESKSAIVQQEINKQKDNIMQNVWGKIKNYSASIFSKFSDTFVQ